MKRNKNLGRSPVSGGHRPMSRREFVEATAIGGAGLANENIIGRADIGPCVLSLLPSGVATRAGRRGAGWPDS